MLEIVICDDEKSLRSALREVIERELQLRGVPYNIIEFEAGEDLLCELRESNFDIIFLDIEMKKLDGIETAKKIRQTNKKAIIIFVTAFPDFVFQGYEVRALNYILKPYKEKKITHILDTALEELDKADPLYYTVEQKSGSTKIALKDTLYFASDKRSITAITKSSEITFYGKLDDLEKELPDFFVRVHNRYLVNLGFITSMNTTSLQCDAHTLPVSRRYKQSLSVAFAKNMLG